MKASFNSARFEFAHGRKPKGRGNWAFNFDSDAGFDDVDLMFFFNGLFSEAKKAAMKEAKRRGAQRVEVCS